MTDRITHDRLRVIVELLWGAREYNAANDLRAFINQQEELDSALPSPPDLVERVARAMYEQHVAEYLASEDSKDESDRHVPLAGYWLDGWDKEHKRTADQWRRRARAALQAAHPGQAVGLAQFIADALEQAPIGMMGDVRWAAVGEAREKARQLVRMLSGDTDLKQAAEALGREA